MAMALVIKDKPNKFNVLMGVDLKEVLDGEGNKHTFLNIQDVATRFSVFSGWIQKLHDLFQRPS